MRQFLRLTWKEVRELLRPRYLLPILLVPILFVALGQGVGGIDDAVAGQPSVGVVVNDTGEYAAIVNETYSRGAEVVYHGSNVSAADALGRTRAAGGTALVVVPGDFSERVAAGQQGGVQVRTVVDSVSLTGVASSGQVDGLLSVAAQRVTKAATGATEAQLDPVDPSYVTLVKGQQVSQPPSVLSGAFTSQFIFIPVVIMLVIVFSGQMVINSMGMEKEHKTLETLLTMPVARRTIVAAKLVGSATVGLLAAGVFTIALFEYQSGLTGGAGALPAAFSLGVTEYLVIGAAIFFAVVGALALALVLGVFAGDRQGAQVLLFPLSVLAIAPAFATMFTDFTTLSPRLQGLLFAIPFTHPVMAPKQLMFGDSGLVLLGVAYEAVFALAAIGLAVYVFNSDRVVTGSAGRLGRWLERLQR
jgi:ABC-2 type transport system permease protein